MRNKYCTNCGAELNENQKFCIKCGAKIGDTANEIQQNADTNMIFDETNNNTEIPFSSYYSNMQDVSKDVLPQNKIIKSLFLFLKNAFDFKGRTRRSDFFQSIIPIIAIYPVVSMIWAMFDDSDMLSAFIIIYPIIFIVPLASIIVRRLHDTGKNGLFILFLILGPIGIVIVLLLCMKDSDEDDNEYGKSIKYINNNYIPNV